METWKVNYLILSNCTTLVQGQQCMPAVNCTTDGRLKGVSRSTYVLLQSIAEVYKWHFGIAEALSTKTRPQLNNARDICSLQSMCILEV